MKWSKKMNKQEAIELVKNTSYSVPIDSSMRYIREETAIKIINCIDEPKKGSCTTVY